MHAIYTTPGFVADSRPTGEAGKILSIFTRDFGMVSAIAQGIRFEKSKLRYHVQNYSLGIFSLVRGKEFWRLTSAQEGEAEVPVSARELVAKIAALLRRLLPGEDPHPELYELVAASLDFVRSSHGGAGFAAQTGTELSSEQAKTLESLIVLRILHSLGYIGNDASLNGFMDTFEITNEVLAAAVPHRQDMNKAINSALRESHL